jgi:hypothetical protein
MRRVPGAGAGGLNSFNSAGFLSENRRPLFGNPARARRKRKRDHFQVAFFALFGDIRGWSLEHIPEKLIDFSDQNMR